MVMQNPFLLTAYDKAMVRQGWVARPLSLEVTPAHNLVGTLKVTLSLLHPMVPYLTPRGSRITCDFMGEQIFSGPLRTIDAQGPTRGGTITLGYEDDARIIWSLFGYPSPTNPVDNQTGQLEDARSGPAETVFKGYASANKGRHPKPITVAPDQGRGGNIDVKVRMTPLADALIDPIDKAGIGFTVRQQNNTSGNGVALVVDCYEPKTIQRDLTELGKAIRSYSWSEQAFTANAAVIGGPNMGTSREFKGYDDTASIAENGDRIEVLVDAASETTTAGIIAAGRTALASAGPTAGFTLELAQTDLFHYGGVDGFHVGDRARAAIIPGRAITDVIRTVVLTFDRDKGFQAKPAVGDHSNDSTKAIVAYIQGLARFVRRQAAR